MQLKLHKGYEVAHIWAIFLLQKSKGDHESNVKAHNINKNKLMSSWLRGSTSVGPFSPS